MPKNIEDMIVPERKRSIRNIPIPEGRRRSNNYPYPSGPSIPPRPPSPPETKFNNSDFHQDDRKFSKIPRKGVWIAAVVAVLILFFAVLSIFNGATLSYLPESTPVSFNNDIYVAQKSGEDDLLYSLIKISEDKGMEAVASGEEQVSRKARGTIVVYNNASTESQRLRATTRFETSDGKIYQIAEAITVPGKRVVDGVSEPGTLEVTVYAERPGEAYNIGLTDFTLPGLEGSSLFSTVYARSKTEMSGGFVGLEKVVSEADEEKVKISLRAALRDELILEARAQVPEGFILFPSLSSVTFEDLPQTASTKKDNVMINMRGNLYGVMFKKSDLSTHLAREKATIAPNEQVNIVELGSLDLAFSDSSSDDLLLSDEIEFSVSGEATAVWIIDETALKTDLAGRHKRDLPSILNNYPNVESVTATIRPFWKSTFPADSSRIVVKKVEVN